MSIRNFLNRFLDSEFGVYPATRGAVVVMPTLTAAPPPHFFPEGSRTEAVFPGAARGGSCRAVVCGAG